MNDTFRKLIHEAPERLGKIAGLWDHSVHYQYPTPATLFLDLIGYSLEEFGYLLCGDMKEIINGMSYVEISKLGEAMDEYATRPDDATAFIQALLEAEQDES